MGYQRQADLDSTAKMAVDALRDAQSRSASGKDFKRWGVYFDSAGNKFVLFRDDGTGYGGATIKEENFLSSFARIGNISINGGGQEIIFNNPNGDTSQYGTIRIEQANNSANFKDIIVTSLGKIDRQ